MQISSLNSSSYIQDLQGNNAKSNSTTGVISKSSAGQIKDSITISQQALQLSQNQALSADKDNDGDAA